VAKHTNSYILIYTCALTLVCASVLYLVSETLKPYQDANVELKRKKDILASVMTLDKSVTDASVEQIYNSRVKGYVVNVNGEVLKGEDAAKIKVEAESKKPLEDRKLPVFEISKEGEPDEVEFYVLATSGMGLWDKISSFIALKSDLNTIEGVVFDHKAETKGLGARIKDEAEVYNRYKGKKIREDDKITSVEMKKGEGNDYSSNPHAVDGMSGATKTAVGVNEMLAEYLGAYKQFIISKSTNSK
jgi:Na+-transporting NADH:ubiquinone oxidoreductase subunit C